MSYSKLVLGAQFDALIPEIFEGKVAYSQKKVHNTTSALVNHKYLSQALVHQIGHPIPVLKTSRAVEIKTVLDFKI